MYLSKPSPYGKMIHIKMYCSFLMVADMFIKYNQLQLEVIALST